MSFMLFGCTGYEPAPLPESDKVVEAPPEPAPKTKTTIVAKKAEAGVGKKGRGYGQGIIATPIGSRFAMDQKITFQKIEHAMNLFKAEHDRAPKDHEEFMEKIIKANHIKLPELREDERYRYYPKEETLMVETLVEEEESGESKD